MEDQAGATWRKSQKDVADEPDGDEFEEELERLGDADGAGDPPSQDHADALDNADIDDDWWQLAIESAESGRLQETV